MIGYVNLESMDEKRSRRSRFAPTAGDLNLLKRSMPMLEESVLPEERRSEARWDLCLPCRIRWKERSFDAQALDLSGEGAFVETTQVLPEGADIVISFLVAGKEASIGSAIVHSGRYLTELKNVKGFGVSFKDPPTEVLSHLKHVHHWRLPTAEPQRRPRIRLNPRRMMERALKLNKEIWLVVSLILISAAINFIVSQNEMVLAFYTLPTLFSAYFYGRRHATLTALASVLLVILMGQATGIFGNGPQRGFTSEQWLQLTVWGGILIVTGYAMGTLYEHMQRHLSELRQTYNGVLMILQHVISNDKYTHNHSYRVSVYATKIAAQMGLSSETIEDIRAAAMLHDIGKLDISRDILYKASQLSEEEYEEMKRHVERGIYFLEPVGGSLRRILPIILAHHDHFDGSGYHPTRGERIPMGARIIAVADVYDAITSDRPYRKAMSPFDAKDIIAKGSGSEFDPEVVEAFLLAFRKGEMEIPEIIV